jgi:3-oxoacyl-[acyl-carrier-protein] synthase-3
MAFLKINNVEIKGIAASVPKYSEENVNSGVFPNNEDARKFISSTGVERRRVADSNTTTSDMCYLAAERLISDLKWEKDSIDCLILVTQSPDYILPATSCILQNRLKLNEECYALDISLGCSGWVYGLSVITNLISNGSFKRGLFLCGETALRFASEKDKSTWPLFGDAGTCVALEYSETASDICFHFATDGSGAETIIIPEGGFRNPFSSESLKYYQEEEGITRNKLHTIMNGMDVFAFGISKAPESVRKLCSNFNLELNLIDYFTFHQANLFMNEKIRKKLKLPEDKVLYSLKDYGNTSSASIPLTIVSQLKNEIKTNKLKHLACGFGVGLSWGSVYFETKNIVCPEIIEF